MPLVGRMPRRNAVLGVAGLAIIGGAIAGPVAAQSGPPSMANTMTTEGTYIPDTAALPAPSPSLAQTPPVAVKKTPPAPFEKALIADVQTQINGYYCGPAATRIAITAAGAVGPTQDDLAYMLGTTTGGTNSALDTTRVLNQVLGTSVYRTRTIPGAPTSAQIDRLRTDIVNAVSNGRGAVANIVGGASDLLGGWHEYDGGHYVSIIGYGGRHHPEDRRPGRWHAVLGHHDHDGQLDDQPGLLGLIPSTVRAYPRGW